MFDASAADPVLAQHFATLAELGARRTASSIMTRIQTSRAAKDHEQTLVELQEIVQELLTERGELLLTASALKDRLVAESIDTTDLQYIANTLIPAVEKLIPPEGDGSEDGEDGAGSAEQTLDIIKQLISPEILTILQVLGFNYKQAIGMPLTELSEAHLRRLLPPVSQAEIALKQLDLQQSLAQLALDPEAYDRYRRLIGVGND